MQILILGGTGFIGKYLSKKCLQKEYNIIVTSRKASLNHDKSVVVWDGEDENTLLPHLEKSDIVINLIGENIGSGRWTPQKKDKIIKSRVNASNALVKALKKLDSLNKPKPHTLFQASAIGYYGLWDSFSKAPLCNEENKLGNGFLARVCNEWENSIKEASQYGLRVCILRFAPVLGSKNGALEEADGFLAQLAKPFNFYLGAIPGSGEQPISFVHIEDLCNAITFLIHSANEEGVFNVCSAQTQDMQSFVNTLAHSLEKPILFRIPSFLLHLALGDMADELILQGQKVSPNRLIQLGFRFKYMKAGRAFENIFIK